MKYLYVFTLFCILSVHCLRNLLPIFFTRQKIFVQSSKPLLSHHQDLHNQDNTIFRLYAYSSSRNGASSSVVSDISEFESQVQLAPTIKAKIQVLKDYSSKKRIHSSSASDRIIALLEQEITDIPSTLIADYLWSISYLGISNRNPQHRAFIFYILYSLSIVSNSLDATAVSRCFVALYRLEIDFTSIPSPDIKSSLLTMITYHSSKFKALQVVNVIFAMSKMKIQFFYLSPVAQSGLTTSIIREQAFIMRQTQLMNMLVYSLAVCNYPLLVAPEPFQQCITEIASELLQQTLHSPSSSTASETQHLANTIYALGKLGLGHVKYDEFSNGAVSRLIWQGISSTKILQRMKDQEMSMTIYGLGGLGYSWNNINHNDKQHLLLTTSSRLSTFSSQGLAMILSGFAGFSLQWSGIYHTGQGPQPLQEQFQITVEKAVITQFLFRSSISSSSSSSIRPASPHTTALISILASMAEMGIYWPTLSEPLREAIVDGIRQHATELDIERICSLLTSLGTMNATFLNLGLRIIDPLTTAIEQWQYHFPQASICQLMYGLAKMKSTWSLLPPRIRQAIVNNLQKHVILGSICLPCTFYSLGLMSANWKDLPLDLKLTLSSSMYQQQQQTMLKERVLANSLYGLALMEAKWDELEIPIKQSVSSSLASVDTLGTYPGHVFMVLWAFGTMSTDWTTLEHTQELQSFFRQVAPKMTASEFCGSIKGFANMNVAWNQFESATRVMIEKGLESHLNSFSFSELAMIMYALALMTFDYDFSSEDLPLFRIFTALAYKYRTLMNRNKRPSNENYHQLQIYFEFLATLPMGQKIIANIFGQPINDTGVCTFIPEISGPTPTVPSLAHARLTHVVKTYLQRECQEEKKIELQHEFNGLRGVYPVDCAVYYDEQIIAFIEVNGEYHYFSIDGVTTLHRTNKLKERLYSFHYPDVPFFRVNIEEIDKKGLESVAQQLAKKIWKSRPADTLW